MKPEYQEKLDKVVEMFLLYGLDYKEEKEFPLSEKEAKHRGDIFEELIESGDSEVLRGLMGMLTMKVEGGAALDESLVDGIASYYTPKQIVEAIFDKFDAIYDNDERPDGKIRTAYIMEAICSDLWRWTKEGFQIFREMFNKIRPRNAERFLNEMGKYKNEEEKPMIDTLREDMKKW